MSQSQIFAATRRTERPRRTIRFAAAAIALTLANAGFAAEPSVSQSPDAMPLALTAAERTALMAEANSSVTQAAQRAASADERAQLAIEPGRRAANASGNLQKRATSARELRRGNAVGLVVGTELMSHRSVTVAANGEHLQACGSEPHVHDAKTAALISRATKDARAATTGQGVTRE
jgi:hypothetical protein